MQKIIRSFKKTKKMTKDLNAYKKTIQVRQYWDNNCPVIFIYLIIDPTGKSKRVYVGKSIDPQDRYRRHVENKSLCIKSLHNNWMYSLIKQNTIPHMLIIGKVPQNMIWEEAETNWISFLRWCGIELTNGTDGGDDNAFNEETKKKARNKRAKLKEEQIIDIINMICSDIPYKKIIDKYAISGNYITNIRWGKTWKYVYNKLEPSIKEKLLYIQENNISPPKWNKGIARSEEAKLKTKETKSKKPHPMLNKQHSKESIEKIRAGSVGRKSSQEIINKRGAKIKEWWSNKEIAKKLNEEKVIDIITMLCNNKSNKEIITKYDISIGTILNIKKGRSWRRVIGLLDVEIKKKFVESIYIGKYKE